LEEKSFFYLLSLHSQTSSGGERDYDPVHYLEREGERERERERNIEIKEREDRKGEVERVKERKRER